MTVYTFAFSMSSDHPKELADLGEDFHPIDYHAFTGGVKVRYQKIVSPDGIIKELTETITEPTSSTSMLIKAFSGLGFQHVYVTNLQGYTKWCEAMVSNSLNPFDSPIACVPDTMDTAQNKQMLRLLIVNCTNHMRRNYASVYDLLNLRSKKPALVAHPHMLDDFKMARLEDLAYFRSAQHDPRVPLGATEAFLYMLEKSIDVFLGNDSSGKANANGEGFVIQTGRSKEDASPWRVYCRMKKALHGKDLCIATTKDVFTHGIREGYPLTSQLLLELTKDAVSLLLSPHAPHNTTSIASLPRMLEYAQDALAHIATTSSSSAKHVTQACL